MALTREEIAEKWGYQQTPSEKEIRPNAQLTLCNKQIKNCLSDLAEHDREIIENLIKKAETNLGHADACVLRRMIDAVETSQNKER